MWHQCSDREILHVPQTKWWNQLFRPAGISSFWAKTFSSSELQFSSDWVWFYGINFVVINYSSPKSDRSMGHFPLVPGKTLLHIIGIFRLHKGYPLKRIPTTKITYILLQCLLQTGKEKKIRHLVWQRGGFYHHVFFIHAAETTHVNGTSTLSCIELEWAITLLLEIMMSKFMKKMLR